MDGTKERQFRGTSRWSQPVHQDGEHQVRRLFTKHQGIHKLSKVHSLLEISLNMTAPSHAKPKDEHTLKLALPPALVLAEPLLLLLPMTARYTSVE